MRFARTKTYNKWRKGTIYVLRKGPDGTPVYVGKTIDSMEKRLSCHRSSAKYSDTRLAKWLRQVGDSVCIYPWISGINPNLLALQEAATIRWFAQNGYFLLNTIIPSIGDW